VYGVLKSVCLKNSNIYKIIIAFMLEQLFEHLIEFESKTKFESGFEN
jgi:hypothetical protein